MDATSARVQYVVDMSCNKQSERYVRRQMRGPRIRGERREYVARAGTAA